MQVYNGVIRMATDQISSVNSNPQVIQRGLVASKIATAYTFIPCDLNLPYGLHLTPISATTDDNGVALGTTTVVPEVVSFDTLSVVADLDAHAAAVAYIPGNIVRATYTGSTEKAYVCIVGHTSTAGPDFDTDYDAGNWLELSTETFIKVTHTAPGASKNVVATYIIFGENPGDV